MTDRPLPDGSRDVRRWPSDPSLFVDTGRCPACFSPLSGARCRVCGLDLAVPASVELLALSARVRDAELERQSFITRMRADQAAREQTAPAPVTAVPPAAPGAVPQHVESPPPPPLAPPAGRAMAAPTPPAPRSGVQVVLLTLGVVLISITAVVFLFVAYFVASFAARAVIIAGASVLVLGASWMLRWRRLPGTAEGVASVAIVLLLLDVWFVRANDLFGSSALSPAAYSGLALLAIAALFTATRLATGIRATGLAAAGLLPAASFLLAASVVPESEVATAAWLGGLAAAVTGASATLIVRSNAAERVVVSSGAFVGGTLALAFGAWALPGVHWNESWSLLAVAAAWILIAFVARRAASVALSILAACATGVAAALAPTLGVVDEVDAGLALWLAPALAGVVACLAAWSARLLSPVRTEARAGFFAAAAVALAASVPGALAGTAGLGWRLIESVPPWGDRGADDVGLPVALEAGAILVPLVVALGSAFALALLDALRRFAAIPLGAVAAAALAVAGIVAEPGLALAILVAVASAALAVAATRMPRRVPGLLPTLAVFGIAAAALAWWVGFADTAAWPWAMLAALALVIGGRILARRIWTAAGTPIASAIHVVVAAVVAAAALASLAPWLTAIGVRLAEPWSSPWMWLGVGAPVLLAVAMFAPSLTVTDRLSATLPLLSASVAASLALGIGTDMALGWIPAGSTAIIGLVGLRTAAPLVARPLLAAATPALLAVAFAAAFTDAGLSIELIAPASAALLAAALGHVVLTHGTNSTTITWIVSVLVTSVVALVVGWMVDERWLVLLILAPVPLLLAAVGGDPLSATHARRHLAWASLPLGVGAAWAWLAGEAVDDVEAYTLPLAAALAVTAILITWRRPPERPRASGRTALFAVAAAVAVLPSIASSGGSELRTLVLVAAGTVVAVAGFYLPDGSRGVPARLLVVATGWTALTGAALVHGAAVAREGAGVLPVEFWPVLALAGGVGVAFAWANTGVRPTRLAEAALGASVVASSLPTLLAIVDGEARVLRSAILFPVLAVAHVASVTSTRRPFSGRPLGWSTLAVLVLGGVIVLALARVDPFDLVTVPIAAALLGAGTVRMRRSDRLGSWPALAPGLAVLLVPSLVADLTDPELWRIVALGVVASAAVLLGAMKRLQAPLVLGGVVLLVHALWQLWPWIADIYEAVWWWLWLGIAGVVLVVLAATYERQLRLARGVVRSIAGLR